MKTFLFALLLLPLAARADIEPGSWELSLTSMMSGQDKPAAQVQTRCLNGDDARDPSRVPRMRRVRCPSARRYSICSSHWRMPDEANWRSAISANGATDCTWRGHSESLMPWKAPPGTARIALAAAFMVFTYKRSSKVSTPEVRLERMLSR